MPAREWALFIDDDGDPHMVINETPGKKGLDAKLRPATKMECEKAINILNEQGSNIIRLHCRNEQCKDVGSWIERSRSDVEKMMFHCEVCGKAMER